MSPIEDFYSNQTIFLTGATGFVGKLILEKLLRTCHEIKKIYVLLRPKKGLDFSQRLEKLLNQPCFDEMKTLNKNFRKKIEILKGDCSEPFLGLTLQDQTRLEDVSLIIHSAALVKFNLKLKPAIYTNVRAVRDLLNMAQKMPKLKNFIYISTAFSHCVKTHIEEKLYDVGVKAEEMILMVQGLDDESLEILTPFILEKWPNCYVYTKALAEQLFEKTTVPFVIIRPAIVGSAYQEPIPGWIDNFQGIVGISIGVSMGLLRSLQIDPKLRSNIVPVDFVVSLVLASARYQNMIYNYVGSDSNSITWGIVVDRLMKYSLKYPMSTAAWYQNFSMTPNRTIHKTRVFFLQTLPAHVVDLFFHIFGKKRIAVRKYQKIHQLMDCLSYFTLRSWVFSDENVKRLWTKMSNDDKRNFNFDIEKLDWENYAENCVIGGRIYLMKDPLETVPKAKKRLLVFRLVHYAFIIFVVFFFYELVTFVF